MRRIVLVCALLFFAEPALAQFTVVSGTVTDANGLPYSQASLTVTITLPTGAVGAYLNGAQIAGTVGPVNTDNTGAFLIRLGDNAQIQCANAAGQLVACAPQTKWTFAVTLSPGVPPPIGKGPQTCTATLTITGASQSVTSSFNACPAISSVNSTSFPLLAPNGTVAAPSYSFANATNAGIYTSNGVDVFIGVNGTPSLQVDNTFTTVISGSLGMGSTGDIFTGASGKVFSFGAAGDTTGTIKSAGYISQGTTFTASGCANTTLSGGASAGSYVSVTAGACTVTVTMGNSLTAPHGWVCDAHDVTTVADANNVTLGSLVSTTQATLVEGTVAANDVIVFKCTGY